MSGNTEKVIKQPSDRNTGRLFIVMAAFLWGLAGVCVKSISWGSFSILTVRSVLSLILMFLFKRSLKLRWTKINIFGGLSGALTGMLYVFAIKLTAAGTAIVLQYIAPILVYIYGVLFKHTKMRLIEMLIVAAVFAGCVLSFSDQLDTTHILGNIFGILSGFAFAAQIIITNGEECDSLDAMVLNNIFTFSMCLPLMFFDKNLTMDAKNLIWVLILGIFQYGMANVCFSRGIGSVSAIEGSLILTIEPIFNPIPVWIFCGEKMGVRAIIGAVTVIVFVALYSVVSKKEQGETPACDLINKEE